MRAWIGKYGIVNATQTTPIGALSDGQKSRVVFAHMAMLEPNLLILDEPTNHLDLETIDALAEAIANFSGGVVLVSHDMRLLEQVVDDIYEVKNKTLVKFNGDIVNYKEMCMKRLGLI